MKLIHPLGAIACAAALLLAGCSGNGSRASMSSEGSSSLTQAQMAEVDLALAMTRAIEESTNPGWLVLQAHGMTPIQFEDLMGEIASNSAMSRAFVAKAKTEHVANADR